MPTSDAVEILYPSPVELLFQVSFSSLGLRSSSSSPLLRRVLPQMPQAHGSPQISSAIWRTSASFFFSSSSVSGYPLSCVLNPH